MTYPEAIQYLDSFINYEKISQYPYKQFLKLERIKDFLKNTLNNPQDDLKCIHIAGTKGKGSTCAFVAYILRQAGFKVGLYTSPHLSDFRERIRILGARRKAQGARRNFEGMISPGELRTLVESLKPEIDKFNSQSKYGNLSFFEVYTALAFEYFKEKEVDFAVLETCLGGRLDATNVVEPLVCAITSISYEHTQKLGNTLREIATEKVGIIKAGYGIRDTGYGGGFSNRYPLPISRYPIVISAPQEKEAMEVIRSRCEEVDAQLYVVGKDITYQKINNGFGIKGIFGEYPNLKIKLLGEHQLINATVAVGAIEALRFYNIKVDVDYIKEGLYNTIWPGRCEVISKNPTVVLDGAQNIASSKALKETIKENFSTKGRSASGGKYKRLILVLGISKDKDIKGICSQFYDLADTIILTRASNPRATPPENLAKYFSDKDTYLTNSVKEAIELATKEVSPQDLILVTGSLFVVGEARELFSSFAFAR